MTTAPRGDMQGRRFAHDLGRRFLDDNVQNVAAMMAYYAMLALFPMLVFVLSLALIVLPEDTVRQGFAMATEAMPHEVRDLLGQRVTALIATAGAGFAVLGAVLALWGASRGTVALMTAFNDVTRATETRSWLRRQLVAIAVTLAIAVLAVIALAVMFVGPWLGHRVAGWLGAGHAFAVGWAIARWAVPGGLVLLVWAIAYRYLPDHAEPLRVFTPGAVIGVALWLGISALFKLYLGRVQHLEATYGTLGGAIIFLIWLWLSNIALLVGAEINAIHRGLRPRERPVRLSADRQAEPI